MTAKQGFNTTTQNNE